MSRISQSQLESYLWGAAEHLRGSIDAGDYKQFIFPLLFLKRLCDVHDEETTQALRASDGDAEFAAFAENHRFQVPAEAHWKEIRKETRNVGQAIQRAMRAIESANKDKLFGIFGDAQWTNKDRLSDETMRELIEHFSSLELTIANLPEDELGQGYEFLIKKFADDSGHTAAEFYTNRTVVHLMTEMLDVQPGESVYDPTCGSGGMLMSCVAHLRKQGKEWRNVRLFGQERNLMTSSIARMNCFLHGIEDFRIERGDTLAEPKLVEGDKLMQFDVVLANPPYSIKQWDREAFRSDPWGRNLFGIPPQGRADYAFQQHINKSLKPKTGRCAVLWPHGVLFRQEEDDIRKKMVDADLIEAVIGLGPNLFYNSSMESCVLICRANKPKERRGKILFINAQSEVTRERTQSFLTAEHIEKIMAAYGAFKSEERFAAVASLSEVRDRNYSLKIDLYVQAIGPSTTAANSTHDGLANTLLSWDKSRESLRQAIADLAGSKVTKSEPLEIARTLMAAFDRTKWRRVRFGDVVRQMKEQVDPEVDIVERYVAGEHMESENVHIKKWGTVGDGYLGPAFIRKFRKGQVLYGSRRTYLKKVAVAEWDGVTANTTFVLESIEGQMLQEFLPWIILSERFTKHSVQESKGSTNPYINYPDIAKFEFDLPPLDQQRRIAEILWAINVATEKARLGESAAISLKKRYIDSCYLDGCVAHDSDAKSSRDCASRFLSIAEVLSDGKSLTYGILQPGGDVPNGVPMLRAIDIENGALCGTSILRVHPSIEARYERTRLRGGEVLVSVMGTIGRTILVKSEWAGWNVNRALAVVRLGPKVSSEFFYYWLSSPSIQAQLCKDSIGTAQLRINLSAFRQYKLPVPPAKEQAEIVDRITSFENLKSKFSQNLASLIHLRGEFLKVILR